MDNNSETNGTDWLADRLAMLRPDTQWQTNRSQGLARFRQRRKEERQRARRRAWILTTAAAIIIVVIAFPTSRAMAERYVSACVKQSSRLGAFLFDRLSTSKATLLYERPADRKAAPDFLLSDSSGTPVRLSEFRGKVVLLHFWTTDCAPCRVDFPWFTEFQQTYRAQDFMVLSVALDDSGWKTVKPYIDAHKIQHRVVVGNQDVARLFGDGVSVPTAFVIDKLGRIGVTHVGLCTKKEYEAAIESMINEH